MKNSIVTVQAGFSNLVEKVTGEALDGHPLWISRFNLTNPNAVYQSLSVMLENGAEIIKANNYQASFEGYMKYFGLSEEDCVNLFKSTVASAIKARDVFVEEHKNIEVKPRVYSSVGSYLATLHDGSEYTGKFPDHATRDFLKSWHLKRLNAICAGGVEGLVFETIPSLLEGEVLVDLMGENYPGLEFYVSFQGKNETMIASGEKFADVAESIWNRVKTNKNHKCLAVGVNCVEPIFATSLLESVKNANRIPPEKIPLIVSANSGEKFDLEKKVWYGKEDCIPLDSYVPSWIEKGAIFIGGCCRTSATDISKIKKAIESYTKSQI